MGHQVGDYTVLTYFHSIAHLLWVGTLFNYTEIQSERKEIPYVHHQKPSQHKIGLRPDAVMPHSALKNVRFKM